MEQVQVPSIGRIVHYRVSPSDPEELQGAPVRPAIIMKVQENWRVDLNIFCMDCLLYLQVVAHGEELGNWFWPPRV